MPLLRYHYYCEACDGTWFAEGEGLMQADCLFCEVRDIFPYRSDAGASASKPRLAARARKPTAPAKRRAASAAHRVRKAS